MNSKIQLIREKCIAANPEIEKEYTVIFSGESALEPTPWLGRPIRLADVLLAMSQTVLPENVWEVRVAQIVGAWNLRTDDLEKQSEETINFLAEVLK